MDPAPTESMEIEQRALEVIDSRIRRIESQAVVLPHSDTRRRADDRGGCSADDNRHSAGLSRTLTDYQRPSAYTLTRCADQLLSSAEHTSPSADASQWSADPVICSVEQTRHPADAIRQAAGLSLRFAKASQRSVDRECIEN